MTRALTLLALAAVVMAWRRAPAQADEWTATPAHPTVGDTVWLVRRIDAPPGWRLRPGKLTGGEDVESLGDAGVLRAAEGWLVRYPIVAWAPGAHEVILPPIWRLAPDGRADSLPGGVARLEVASVIPDSLRQPEPRNAIGPLRLGRRRPLLPIAALGLALALGAGALAWRRRAARPPSPALRVPVEREGPDARWLAAGEPKAVAARAAARVRAAITRAGPRPAPALAEVLEQLERIEFAAAHEADVAALASRARALTPERAS